MRDLIYELSDGQSQIIATTHSPYLIDLSRKPRQVLNRFHYDNSHTTVYPLSVTEKFLALQDNDKDQIKMLIKLDDHVSRIFLPEKLLLSREIQRKSLSKKLSAECQKQCEISCLHQQSWLKHVARLRLSV